MGTMFNPMNVMMGQPGKTGVPYFGGKSPSVGPVGAKPMAQNQTPTSGGTSQMVRAGQFTAQNPPGGTPAYQAPPPPANVMGAESVRATGTGPFDSAYRQDLATYAGGLFGRPGGNLSFNPTSNDPFGGAATGAGSDPVLGMPNTLLQNALGGNPFSYAPPAPKAPAQTPNPMQAWLQQFLQQGSGSQRGGRMAFE
jgi:hypothetical protein